MVSKQKQKGSINKFNEGAKDLLQKCELHAQTFVIVVSTPASLSLCSIQLLLYLLSISVGKNPIAFTSVTNTLSEQPRMRTFKSGSQ